MSNEKITRMEAARLRRKPGIHLWSVESMTASMACVMGYYRLRVPDFRYPKQASSLMEGDCPLCWSGTLVVDPLYNYWFCSTCNLAGNHWALEYQLFDELTWEQAAEQADRIMAEERSQLDLPKSRNGPLGGGTGGNGTWLF